MNNLSKFIFKESYRRLLVELLCEGGAAKHMTHPFDFVKNGKELIKVFKDSVDSLENGSGSVKIDGINASIRFVNGRFVLDRGSAKSLDINGIRPEDLESRFGTGHGMTGVGTKVIHIFDESLHSTQLELKSLGLMENPNIMLNIEYVEGQSNVISYDIKNFLAIHGLLEIFTTATDKSGNPKSRGTREISYDTSVMESYIKKLNVVAEKRGFNILGSIKPTFKTKPNLTKPLSEMITVKFSNGSKVDTLLNWLKYSVKPTTMPTREECLKIFSSNNVESEFEQTTLNDKVNGAILWHATIKMGDEILNNLTSEIGPLDKHEGVVIRDSKIYSKPFKITGSFIINGMTSKFNKG